MNGKPSLDSLLHYGVKRRSGRYPWGSGEDPNQGEGSTKFLGELDTLRSKGMSDTEIANHMGITTTQLRNNITWANKEIKEARGKQIDALKEAGLTNVAIAKKVGLSEAGVRDYLSKKSGRAKVEKIQLDNVLDAIKTGVDKTGYLDVGVGVERQLGVPRNKFNTAVNKLAEEEGYHIHQVLVKRLSDPTGDKSTTVKVLTKDPDSKSTYKNRDLIRPLDSWSDDGGLTLNKAYPPHMLNLDRIKVRYKEEGGADKDGTIELRPGVKDLDLGNSKYAQVRIAAGENLYLKGMAIYGDPKDFPKGVDIIYNRPESKDVPKEEVLKKMKMSPEETDDPSFMFGTSIRRQKGALNIVYEQGEWDKWSGKMSSQFLSKQSIKLIKDRLDATYDDVRKEYEEINSMTNPVVKKYLMDKFIEGLPAKAKHLKAKGITGTKSHVLLPFPDMKPNEIYAPNFNNGDRVVLVRHPHGGIFEIPELVVNNKHEGAKKMLGIVPDAVGIHPSVAEKLSGADFDGDTALVIPNNKGDVKTSRSLKELKNFDPKMYKVDYQPITNKAMQTQMGMISNLITDMTIKGASQSELANAVRHSMVVIDSYKHKLDYKQSEIDHGISALKKRYQSHTNPETGKKSVAASTLISRSKNKIDITQHETARELSRDKVDKNGKVIKPGLTPSEIAAKLNISEDTVNGYLYRNEEFNPDKYVSETSTAQEHLYSNYIKNLQMTRNEAMKSSLNIAPIAYSKEAAKIYAPERESLNEKLNAALLNAPKARQVQLLTNKLYYANLLPDMDKDQKKKLKSRALAKATATVGAKKAQIELTAKEWEAIQAGAVSKTMLLQILDNANIDTVRKLATPRELKLNTAKASRARLLLDKGYTYAEVANATGVSIATLREELR